MRTTEKHFAVSTIALAVHGALIAMCAAPAAVLAADETDDINALINPTNYVEVGAINVSQDSAKFGEYNGLNKKGGYVLGNFGVRGGDAYGQGTGTMRWEVKGNDLGTTSRSLGASVSDQGTWSLGIGYDELRHNITDTYQTPYQGSQGSNNFTLPSNFGPINTTANANGARNLSAAQLSSFHTEDIHSDRKNTSFNAGYIFNPQWDVKFDYNHLDQSGSKLIGAGSDKFGPTGGTTFTGETIAILMNPTQYKTDTFNLALNWSGEKAHATMAYYGSLFHDDFRGVSWQSPFESGTVSSALPTSTMSTPPSNQFHQLNFTGGYAFTSATKLAGGFSYARNTQNESYDGTYTPGRVFNLPTNSLNGLVVTTHADLKLTNQTTKDLVLSAGVKYNERDNRTDSHVYLFDNINSTTASPGSDKVFNVPMSNRRTQMELAGDYRIDKRQNLHVGYEYDHIKRWCSNSVPGNVLIAPAGLASAATYYGMSGTDCAQVPQSTENKLALGYRLRATDDVNVTAGYSYGKRKSDVNSSFYNPMQGQNQGFENFGYVAFFDASRKEQMLKAGVNWQATERLNLSMNGRYTKDNYDDSTLGVQDGHTDSINLDATYNLSENNSISVYSTWQQRKRDYINAAGRNTIALLPNQFTNNLNDRDKTVGIGAKQNGLIGGKLQLAENLTYSDAKTSYSTNVPYTLASCTATSNLSCGDVPDIKEKMLQFKLTGSYQVSKPSKVVMGYMYQHLNSNDPAYYNIYQYGYTATTILPTNQQAPNYNVNTVFVAYNYSFQ
jgi:MtrB/PioB family decaheme-associated outer membrane protein